MHKITFLVSGLVVLLITCVLFTGCTDNSSTTNTTTTASPGSHLFVSGDIVRIPNSGTVTAILIIGYDSVTDTYERALIYPNADGSWGYRRDSSTEKEARAVMEKVYTEKITNKPVSSIPIRAVTIVTTATTTRSTTATTITTSTTPTTTTMTSAGARPTFKKIVPDAGTAGTEISITSLTGTNFMSGAAVTLMKEDSPNITASDVSVVSSTLITCTFNPPANSTPGAWDLVITNPDGQFVRYNYEFSITAPLYTSTTTSSSSDSEGIDSITPTFTYGNDIAGGMMITGSNFQQGFTAKLTKSTDTNIVIEARSVRWDSATQVTAWFTLTTKGTWNVIVTNPDGTTRTLLNGFESR